MIAGRAILYIGIVSLWLGTGHSLPSIRVRKSVSSEQDCENDEHDTLMCGSNDVTYLNLCEFEKALVKDPKLKVVETGACACSEEEHHEWDPLCASNGQSYANNCELMKARKHEHLNVRHDGLCNALLQRDTITYRELQEVKLWKSFMPHDLYKTLSNRQLADGDPEPEGKSAKHRNKKNNKKKKLLAKAPSPLGQFSSLLNYKNRQEKKNQKLKMKSNIQKLLFTSNAPRLLKLFGY